MRELSARSHRTLHGLFKPLNPHKYRGDPTKIVYRSSWELHACRKFDKDPRILWWASEEVIIPYYNSVKKRQARYFVDFVIAIDHGNGIITKTMIEVKPHTQCHPPKAPKVKKRRSQELYVEKVLEYQQNQDKWNAAQLFCEKHGMKFVVMDEYSLGLKKRPVRQQ